jgi:UDP-N-acetylmuramate dehydrogenase
VFALSRTPQRKLDYGHLNEAVKAAAGDGVLTPALIRRVIIKIRKEKLPEPSVMGSAGSFFKNPVISAEHFARIEAAAKAEYGPDYKVPHYIVESSNIERRVSTASSASAKCSENIEAAAAPASIEDGGGMPLGAVASATGGENNAPTETSTLVSVGSGVIFDDFCEWAAKEGLWGVENLSYIPGEVGASAVQNIGAYGVEVKDVIKKVYCYDTQEEEFVHFDVDDCEYGYRDSIFKDPEIKGRYIVTHVVFALSRTPQPKLDYGHLNEAVKAAAGDGVLTPAIIRRVIIKIRKEKLPEPSVMGSAGSFFKNPVISAEHFARIEAAAKAEHGPDYKVPHYIVESSDIERRTSAASSAPVAEGDDRILTAVKIPAAWMIEQCGWKGRRSGNAAVYEKQPLVIVNYTGEAYPEEIIGLEKRIIDSVKKKFDIELHPEVEHI